MDERDDILQKINDHAWASSMRDQLVARVQNDLSSYESDRDAYLRDLPIDWSRTTPRFFTNSGFVNNVWRHKLNMAQDCSVIYYLTGDPRYAALGADVLHNSVRWLLRTPKDSNTSIGGWTFHDREWLYESRAIGSPMPIIYDFLHGYLQSIPSGMFIRVWRNRSPFRKPRMSSISSGSCARPEYFGTTANIGPAADDSDANLDGESNLLEFATGQNPHVPTRLSTALTMNGNSVQFRYPRGKAALADGITFAVKWSDTLQTDDWNTVGVTAIIDPQNPGNSEVDNIIATVPLSLTGKRFIRLEVTTP
jgi:hypothetical protein